MSTSKTKSATPMAELSLDALDLVIGGNSAAPMGLGGSLAAPIPAIGAHAATGSSSPTGYNDHFGISMGGVSATDAHAAAAGVGASHSPSPMGLGGSMPSGAPINSSSGSDHGSATTASGATQNATGHGPTGAGTGAGNGTGDHGGDPTQAGQNASDHHSHEAVGVNANSAFNLVDSAAQDAIAILHGEQLDH